MIVIDGALGEGGGQILRTALALSLCTGRAFRIDAIRAGRSKPGLMRQHLTAVEAAVAIGNAETSGAELGSQRLEFRPGRITAGRYRFSVGTAGSAMLVLQTVLPPLLMATAPSQLALDGGTHNPSAPPFEFIARSFLPALARMGAAVDVALVRPGFHPAGGGQVTVSIQAAGRLRPIEILDRGELVASGAEAFIAGLPLDIARRELSALGTALEWSQTQLALRPLDPECGPGNVLLATLTFAQTCEVFSSFGILGVSAEHVALLVAERANGFLDSPAAVGPHLADQLLLPFALAGGGRFLTVKPSVHTRSNAKVIESFLGAEIAIREQANGAHLVEVAARS